MSLNNSTSHDTLIINDHELHRIYPNNSHDTLPNTICFPKMTNHRNNTPPIKYDTDCIMCMESADPRLNILCDIAHLSCGHIYHYNCLMSWQQTIQHYFLTNIECCICKQSVSLTGIWHTNGKYHPITHNYDLKRLHDPLLSSSHIDTNFNTMDHQPRQRRRLISYIPGFKCCTSIT